MKQILCLLMCSVVMFTTRCSSTGFSRDAKTDVVYSNSDVAIEIDSVTNSKITLLIENKTTQELSYDESVYIERKNDGVWYASDNEQSFTDLARVHEAGEKAEFTYSFENLTSSGTLSAGEYRVIKPVGTTSGDVNLAVDFEITE